MNPIQLLILNILGQVGAVHIGIDPPENTKLLWCQIDAQDQPIAWKDHTKGYWSPTAQTEVIDNFNSTSTTKAASARLASHLFGLISDLQAEVDDIDLNAYLLKNSANTPNGYALIDPVTGKVSPQVIPYSGFDPQPAWDASTGDPPSQNPVAGQIWPIKVAGNTNLDGNASWALGDYAYYTTGGTYDKLPGFNLAAYNALDQEDPGYLLDARQGKVIWDAFLLLSQAVTDLEGEVDALDTRLIAAEDEIASLQSDKQDKCWRHVSVITDDKFDHAFLGGKDLKAFDIKVNGQNQTGDLMTKAIGDTTIYFIAGTWEDDTEIILTYIP